MKTMELETTKHFGGRWAVLAVLSTVLLGAVALVTLIGCGETTPVGPTAPAPPTEPVDPQPMAAAIADGSYLTAVLGGDVDDALTVEGAKALSAEVLTDAEVEALIAADWWKPVDELITASPKVTAMLAALAPVYGKHVPAATFSPIIREGVAPEPGEEHGFIPSITLGTYRATADAALRIAGKMPGAARTTSCYLTAEETALLTGAGDEDAATRAASCFTSAGSLSAMQAVELVRTCPGGECAGAAGRGILAAVGATVLHGLAANMANELSNMVTAGWFLGSWVGIHWDDDDDDGAGTVREYVSLTIGPTRANWFGLFDDFQRPENLSLGPWSHQMTTGVSGTFSSGDEVIEYEYVPNQLNIIVAQGWLVRRVGPEIVGTWSGTTEDASIAYEIAIVSAGQATLKTSGTTKSGVVGHEEHFEGDDEGRIFLMADGRPELNGCGNLWFALGEGANPQPSELTEGQEWRYCIDDDNPDMMYAQAPPLGDDWMFDITLTRN